MKISSYQRPSQKGASGNCMCNGVCACVKSNFNPLSTTSLVSKIVSKIGNVHYVALSQYKYQKMHQRVLKAHDHYYMRTVSK